MNTMRIVVERFLLVIPLVLHERQYMHSRMHKQDGLTTLTSCQAADPLPRRSRFFDPRNNVRPNNKWRTASTLNHPPGSVRQLGGSYTLVRQLNAIRH